MKITKRQLRRIIKEALLLEEPSDYYRDYKAGTISYAEYQKLVQDYERGQISTPQAHSSRSSQTQNNRNVVMPEKIWKGSKKDLEKKVHGYLIDIDFYKPYGDSGYANPFTKGSHPDGGYTSNIPGVIKKAIADGEIDWATWPEIEPTYRKIDRSID